MKQLLAWLHRAPTPANTLQEGSFLSLHALHVPTRAAATRPLVIQPRLQLRHPLLDAGWRDAEADSTNCVRVLLRRKYAQCDKGCMQTWAERPLQHVFLGRPHELGRRLVRGKNTLIGDTTLREIYQ